MTRKTRTQEARTESLPQRRVLVLHGPNLNLFSSRDATSGEQLTLADVHTAMESRARADGVQLESFQSNHEGELIDRVQAAGSEGTDFIIINPAGSSGEGSMGGKGSSVVFSSSTKTGVGASAAGGSLEAGSAGAGSIDASPIGAGSTGACAPAVSSTRPSSTRVSRALKACWHWPQRTRP